MGIFGWQGIRVLAAILKPLGWGNAPLKRKFDHASDPTCSLRRLDACDDGNCQQE